ncbi:MAG: beta-propeller domain-containing protein [Candidatus Hydrogenedentes bacterium]|nr:beta-propeller domain-containing protein [Candidatus Hydrogenedentota bacterium]
MRALPRLPFLFLIAVLVSGCPWFTPGNRAFTSADTGRGPVFDAIGAGAEGGAPDAEGGGGLPREVVEPDVIRRQDNLLYVLNQYRGLSIVDLDTDTLLAQVPATGYPRDLYFAGGMAYVLVGYASDVSIDAGVVAMTSQSRLYAVDVSTPADAAIRSHIDLPGDLVDSRLVGDVLYAVTAAYDYGYYEDVVSTGSAAATTVTSISVADPDALAQADQIEFTGSGTVVHVTPEFAFIAAPDWAGDSTVITCLDIRDPGGAIRNAGSVRVRGYLDDRFKMDAWNGALRVVSSAWEAERQVYLSTFDLTQPDIPRLAELRIEGAEGETLFATRFDGPRAYVVTFLIVDPLFVIDVADPAAPQLLGALEVPGYSTYIQPQGDRLVALGVDDTVGRRVSVSLFDVSGNGAPSLVDRESFGEDWAWSNAFSDVKALTILDDVIIVPFAGWGGHGGGFERLQFLSYTRDDLQLHGAVDLSGNILRSFEYDAFYFGVTTEQVTRIDASNLDNPVAVASVTIAENLVDFLEIGPDLGAELVARYDEGTVIARAVNAAGDVLGELELPIGQYFDAWQSGETLVVAGITWDEKPGYTVAVVDLADPASPALLHEVPVDVYPWFYNYFYYDYGFARPEPAVEPGGGAVAGDIAIGLPYYYFDAGEKGFLLGETLALRCSADRYDRVYGRQTPDQGLALVNIRTGRWTATAGLGYGALVSLNAVDGLLYAGTKEPVASGIFGPPLAAYYLRTLDVVNGIEGTAANVPGAFVQYDPDTDLLVLHDYQWDGSGRLESSLETVRWSGGGSVTPIGSAPIASYTSRVVGAGARVYYDSHDPAYAIHAVAVSSTGALTPAEPVAAEGAYGSIIGARGDHVFASLGYNALAHYTFSGNAGELASLTPVSGYPSAVRFGSARAYFPLGYYGLVSLPLSAAK